MPLVLLTFFSVAWGRKHRYDRSYLFGSERLKADNNFQIASPERVSEIPSAIKVLTILEQSVEVYPVGTGKHFDDCVEAVSNLSMIHDDLVVPSVLIEDDLAAPSVRAPQNLRPVPLASLVRLCYRINGGSITNVEPCYCQRIVAARMISEGKEGRS